MAFCPYPRANSNQSSDFTLLKKHIVFNQEVRDALHRKLPIVALESTVLSHGLPYPENLDLAKSMEDIVRKNGSVPCTIALLDGKIHFGLDASEIERLAFAGKKGEDKPKENIHKVSVRDLGWILATKACGATTVAATSFLASKIGVRVFATGGIGGVHRDGHITMDVSADLIEMSRSPVIVVCAGAKSILDIPRTLEYLETLGVPVIGYGTNEFPAFFTRSSGCQVPLRLDTPEAVAKLMQGSIELGVGRGALVAVPISPKDEADGMVVEKATETALKEAEEKKITGRDITPFLLGRVSQLTSGQSLRANIALLQQNALVAALIAKELNQLENPPTSACPYKSLAPSTCPMQNPALAHRAQTGRECPYRESVSVWKHASGGEGSKPVVTWRRDVYRPVMCHQTGQFGCRCGSASSSEDLNNVNAAPPRVVTVKPSKGPVVVIGGIAVDVLSKPQNTLSSSSSEQDVKGHSIPGHITMTAGGVGRNIAETLSKFGMLTTLISALGTGTLPDDVPTHFRPDQFGQFLLDDCRKKKIALLAPVIKNKSTAVYSAMSYPDGTFRGGVAHMEVLSHVIPSVVDRYQFQKTKFIVLDCNIPVATISHVLRIASSVGIPTLVEPTSALKATKLRDVDNLKAITFLKPNRVELEAIAVALRPSLENPQQQPSDVLLKILIDAGIQHVILTNGAESVKVAKADTSDPSKLEIHEIPIETSSKLVDVNGAGDSLVGGFIFAYLSGLPLLQAVRFGLRAARLTSESTHSVSPLLNSSLLQEFASSIAKL